MAPTLPTGIKKYGRGYRVYVRVSKGRDGLKSKVFPAHTPLMDMKHWREEQRVSSRTTSPPTKTGTLAADITRYLALVKAMPTWAGRARDLDAWRTAFGDTLSRAAITTHDCRRQLHAWRTSGGRQGRPLAASTVNQRRTALMHLYRVLDGKSAPNPLADIPRFPEPPPEPRDIGIETVRAIIDAMPYAKNRARIKVLLWTGARGTSEIGKMTRAHVDLERATCWIPTGKGGRPRDVTLNEDGIAAWREFAALDAWGPYSPSRLRKSFQKAVTVVNEARKKAKQPPLTGLRVYDLRHTIATALRRAGADLADVQHFLGHTTGKMTQRYAPYQSDKLRAAVHQLS